MGIVGPAENDQSKTAAQETGLRRPFPIDQGQGSIYVRRNSRASQDSDGVLHIAQTRSGNEYRSEESGGACGGSGGDYPPAQRSEEGVADFARKQDQNGQAGIRSHLQHSAGAARFHDGGVPQCESRHQDTKLFAEMAANTFESAIGGIGKPRSAARAEVRQDSRTDV